MKKLFTFIIMFLFSIFLIDTSYAHMTKNKSTPKQSDKVEIEAILKDKDILLTKDYQVVYLNLNKIKNIENDKLKSLRLSGYIKKADSHHIKIMMTQALKKQKTSDFIKGCSKIRTSNKSKLTRNEKFILSCDHKAVDAMIKLATDNDKKALKQLTKVFKEEGSTNSTYNTSDNTSDKSTTNTSDKSASGSGGQPTQQTTTSSSSDDKKDDDSTYKDPKAWKQAEEKFTPISEGCGYSFDVSAELGHKLARIEHTKDGKVIDKGECSSNVGTYKLYKNYKVCQATIDKKNNLVNLMYKWAFKDEDDTEHMEENSKCVTDKVSQREIQLDRSICPIYTDVPNQKVLPQASSFYQDENDKRVSVEDCHQLTNEAMDFDWQKGTDRIDIASETAYSQARPTVNYKGSVLVVGSYEDHGDKFPLKKDFNACEPLKSNNGVVPMFKYTYNGQEASSCMAGSGSDVAYDTSDCDLDHDFVNHVSYEMGKPYVKSAGISKPISGCMKTGVTYPHSLEANGYDLHDTQKFYFTQMQYFITINGKHTVLTQPKVQSGATQIPYTLVSDDLKTLGVHYDTCNKSATQERVAIYMRPDSTKYTLKEPTSTKNYGYSCHNVAGQVSMHVLKTITESDHDGTGGATIYHGCHFSRSIKTYRDDNIKVNSYVFSKTYNYGDNFIYGGCTQSDKDHFNSDFAKELAKHYQP